MTNYSSTPTSSTSVVSTTASFFQWRVIDIVTAAVLGVACGFVFWAYNGPGYGFYEAANALTPGFGGIAVGPWLFAGVLGGLVIRKAGAAVLVETLAAVVSAGFGNQWGITTIYSGFAQGLGAELVLAFLLYKKFGPITAGIAGIGTAVGAWVLEYFLFGNNEKTLEFNLTYLAAMAISGFIIAGLGSWLLMRALASTGALDRFAAGRERVELV